MFILTEI